MSLIKRNFNPNSLISLGTSEDFNDPREPQLTIGNVVMLNSGGPPMLVVDFWEEMRTPGIFQDEDGRWHKEPKVPTQMLVLAWKDRSGRVHERDLPRPCVHRVCIA
jgi:uncharacterized protein YodC (DUF2158 family)